MHRSVPDAVCSLRPAFSYRPSVTCLHSPSFWPTPKGSLPSLGQSPTRAPVPTQPPTRPLNHAPFTHAPLTHVHGVVPEAVCVPRLRRHVCPQQQVAAAGGQLGGHHTVRQGGVYGLKGGGSHGGLARWVWVQGWWRRGWWSGSARTTQYGRATCAAWGMVRVTGSTCSLRG